MKKIIIFGIGSFAKLVSFYLQEKYEIIAYSTHQDFILNDTFLNKPLIAFEDIEINYPPSKYNFFIAIGYSKMNSIRERIYNLVKLKGYDCISYIHPSATITSGFIATENTLILENTVIQPFVHIGKNVIIWANSTICHDCIINDHVFIASNCCINGFVEIKNNVFIGAGATIRDKIIIGEKSLIGAGCTVLNSLPKEFVCKAQNNTILSVDANTITI